MDMDEIWLWGSTVIPGGNNTPSRNTGGNSSVYSTFGGQINLRYTDHRRSGVAGLFGVRGV